MSESQTAPQFCPGAGRRSATSRTSTSLATKRSRPTPGPKAASRPRSPSASRRCSRGSRTRASAPAAGGSTTSSPTGHPSSELSPRWTEAGSGPDRRQARAVARAPRGPDQIPGHGDLERERPERLEPGWPEGRRSLAPETGADEDAARSPGPSPRRAVRPARRSWMFEPARARVPWLRREIAAAHETARLIDSEVRSLLERRSAAPGRC